MGKRAATAKPQQHKNTSSTTSYSRCSTSPLFLARSTRTCLRAAAPASGTRSTPTRCEAAPPKLACTCNTTRLQQRERMVCCLLRCPCVVRGKRARLVMNLHETQTLRRGCLTATDGSTRRTQPLELLNRYPVLTQRHHSVQHVTRKASVRPYLPGVM
jgi:hypothetical protein